MPKQDNRLIGIDVDGCIAVGDYHKEECTPIPEARDALVELVRRGFTICYHTARSFSGYVETMDWLDRNGFPKGQLVMGKPNYRWMLGDECISSKHNSWDGILMIVGGPDE